MDEPLSNLDAKLRVQLRVQIARLQRDLDVTMLYVTHDQVEAMTLGHRVAVGAWACCSRSPRPRSSAGGRSTCS
jgi:ABC-type sugar transport system ATPase subunit